MCGSQSLGAAPPPPPPSPGEMYAVGGIPVAGLLEPSLRDLQKAAFRYKFPDGVYLISFELVRTDLRTRVRLLLTSGESNPRCPN